MLATSLTKASETLEYAAGLIAAGLEPTARAHATAAMFRQLGDSAACDHPLTPADLVAGLEAVSKPLDLTGEYDEPVTIAARRKTCREIATLLRPVPAGGDPKRLAAVLRTVESHYSRSTDPRHVAIATTDGREAFEIEALQA